MNNVVLLIRYVKTKDQYSDKCNDFNYFMSMFRLTAISQFWKIVMGLIITTREIVEVPFGKLSFKQLLKKKRKYADIVLICKEQWLSINF